MAIKLPFQYRTLKKRGDIIMGKEKYIRGLFIEPNQYPRKLKIENGLSAFQKAVNGYIEIIDLPNGSTIICNEEGKINGEKLNRILYNDCGEIIDVIAGNMVIVGFNAEEGEFVSMTDEQIAEATEQFLYPDLFFKINDDVHMVNINWLFNFSGDKDIVFTDRNTSEEKHKITCKDDIEQLKLYAFINRNRSEVVRNMNCDITTIEISGSKEPTNQLYDFGDEER